MRRFSFAVMLFAVVGVGAAGCGDGEPASCAADAVPECVAPVTAECSAELSAVDIASPPVCSEHSLSSDAPAGGYPVGETTVTFTNDTTQQSCTTVVTVSDSQAPSITCEPTATFVRTVAGQVPVNADDVVASDSCVDQVDVTFAPTEIDSGQTDIEYTATDAAGNTASCTTTASVIDLYAVDLQIISSAISGANTNVTLAWDVATAGDATGFRVERADAPTGPWTALDTTGVNVHTYVDTLAADSAYYRVVTVSDADDGGISNSVRGFAIAGDTYDVRDVTVPGISFDTTLYGVVRYPSTLTEGPFPLVVVLHGNHGNCRETPTGPDDFCATTQDHDCASAGDFTTPNAEGYIYFLETLASQGYVAVSISGNAMNCRNDYIIERAQLIIEHLRHWARWNLVATGPFGDRFLGNLDLSRVGLVGHSRGGDAVSNVPDLLAAGPVAGVTVRSVFALAPTDFHNASVPGTELAVLLPGCDGDVFDLQGMQIYDSSLVFNDGAQRSQVLFVGANHNYFNTEWLSDDNNGFACPVSENVGRPAQMGMLEATLGSWFRSTLMGAPLEPFMTADADPPSSMDAWSGVDLDLRWSYSSSSRLQLDDFDGANAPDTNAFGEANTFTGGFHALSSVCIENGCSTRYLHDITSMRLLWEAGNTPIAHWGLGGFDATPHRVLSFRVVSRQSTLNSGLSVQDFRIRISDTNGEVAAFLLSDYKTLNHQYPANQPWGVLQTVRIPITDLAMLNPNIDPASLDSLEFEMTALDRSGAVAVTNFEFAD